MTIASHILFRLVTTLVVLLGVVAAVCASTARAQDADDPPTLLADLLIASEQHSLPNPTQNWKITVWNNPVGDQGPKFRVVKVEVVINDGINAPVTEVHTIRDLPAGRSADLFVPFPVISPGVCGSSPVLSRVHAKIIETDPLEPPGLRFNNATENVGLACPSTKFNNGDAGVRVKVSDRSPQPGGTATFTVLANNDAGPFITGASDHNDVQFDVRVKISLSPGLNFGTTTAPDGTTFSTTTGNWDVGTLTPPDQDSAGSHKSLPVAVNLTADSVTEIPLEKRCLTAEVTRANPWFAWDGSKRLNDTYTACLGETIPVRLNQGDVNLFHYLDCVGVATAPCTSADTLELLARTPIGSTAPTISNAQPDELIVHIRDPEGRHGSTRSAFRGTIWSTGTASRHPSTGPQVEGVGVNFQFVRSGWSAYRWTISDVSPKQRPGALKIIHSPRFLVLLDADTMTSLGPINLQSGVTGSEYPAFVTFGALGTYKINLTVRASKSSTPYTDTGTYTFRVGPMADLELRDAGTSPAVAAGRRGYTVMALNNGPDIPPSVQVTLSGVPEGAEAVLSHGHGSYAQGTCQDGLCEGVWAIGELGLGDYRASGHANEGPTLTLITDNAMPADITAAITNTQDYSVCLDSDGADVALTTPSGTDCTNEDATNSWHSTEYYDHIERNNTATIAARAGSGDGRPDAPTNLRVVETPVGNIVQWEAVETVNGHGVTHYQVQRSASPWETLSNNLKGTVYADMAGSGSASYRVRAVNQFDVPGSWSQPSGRPGAPGNFRASIGSGQINLSWSAPQGVTVTGYHLDYSTDGGDTWNWLPAGQTRTALAATPTSYGHTVTLTPGAAWHYRLRAVGDGFTSGWEEASVTVPYPKPGVPVNFAAEGESETQAELTWTAPALVTGVSVTGYELGFSTDGGGSWTSVTGTPTQSGMDYTLTHSDTSLGADAVRQYRARTKGTVGSGSDQVTVQSGWVYALATENYPSPGAPQAFTARAINQSQVNLSWSAPEAVSGVNITGYDLDFSTDGNNWTSLAQGRTQTDFEHIDEDLAAGALRQYRLRAVGTANNAVFRSGWVFASAATEAVGPPQNLTAAPDPDASRNRIDLTWGGPAFGAELVTGYRIDYALGSSDAWQTLEHGYRTIPRSYEHTGLSPGQQYCYRVAATYAGGTGPFAARTCATTEGAPTDLPGEPENLRFSQVGSNYVTLEWDPPSAGGELEYYQWRSNIHDPQEVAPRTATSVTVRGLSPSWAYGFQVRAGNSYGPGQWSREIQVTLNPAGGAVKASPAELQVDKGGSGSFNVSLNRAPQWPLMLYLSFDGPDCLTEGLLYQQGKILVPDNPSPSKEFWEDPWWGPQGDRLARPWRNGLDILVDASGCRGGETAVVQYDLTSLPFSYLDGLPMWEELNLNQEEWREKWGVDPLDGVSGPSVKVTVEDGGASGQQGGPGAAGELTAVTLALDAATVGESAGQVTLTATLDGPAPEGGIGGFLFAGEDGTASEHIDFTMPFEVFIPGGQRSATATVSITDDDLDEADETVVLSALFDIGTALLEDKVTLTITDDDTAGVTITAVNPLSVSEGSTATYTVALDSQPTADVTVSASSGDGAKVSVSPGTNTFTPSAWDIPLTFIVSGLADTDTNDESVVISHWITSDDWKYAVLPVDTMAVSVSDTTPEQQPDPANQAPTVSSAIADATIINESGTKRVSLSGVFSDADNDALTIAAASDDEAVATVSVASDYATLTVAAKSKGTATIWVAASDGRGGTASDSFTVTVKAAPVVASAMSDVSGMEVFAAREISLSGVFSDADGDSLTLSAASSDNMVVDTALVEEALTIFALEQGTATITVTAKDPNGNTVSDSFDVSVVGPPTPVANLRCIAETDRVAFLWDAPKWPGGRTYAYDYQLTLPGGKSEGGRIINSTLLLRTGTYQAGAETSVTVTAVYELPDGSEVRSVEETLTCTVAE